MFAPKMNDSIFFCKIYFKKSFPLANDGRLYGIAPGEYLNVKSWSTYCNLSVNDDFSSRGQNNDAFSAN